MIEEWARRLKESRLISATRKIVLPGFDGIPIYDVGAFFVRGLMKGALNTRATSLSFQFFLSLFPTIIFLFTLIAFVPIDNFQDELLLLIKEVLPESAYELTASTLDDIINRQRGGLLSIVFLVVVYLSTNGIDAMLEAFGESIHIERKRGYFVQKLVAFGILSLFTLLLIFAIALVVFSEFAVDYLREQQNISGIYLLQATKWLIIVALYYFCISFIYYFGNVRRVNWKFFSAGSSMATVMSILLSVAFAYYVNNFAMYNKLYGSIGTLLVILLWIYFNAFVVLIGFELNVSIQQAGAKRLLN